MASKVLGRLEAVEIINTLLDEYGLDHIDVVWSKEFECWTTPDVTYKKKRFLFITWTKRVLKGNWVSASTLEDLIVKVEEFMDKNYSEKHSRVRGIRERHAARLLDKKMEEGK